MPCCEHLIFMSSVASGFLALMPASLTLHSFPSARTCEISWVEWRAGKGAWSLGLAGPVGWKEAEAGITGNHGPLGPGGCRQEAHLGLEPGSSGSRWI